MLQNPSVVENHLMRYGLNTFRVSIRLRVKLATSSAISVLLRPVFTLLTRLLAVWLLVGIVFTVRLLGRFLNGPGLSSVFIWLFCLLLLWLLMMMRFRMLFLAFSES